MDIKIEEKETVTRKYQIDNTTFIVNSFFSGTKTLEDVLVKMIVKDIENKTQLESV